MNGEGGVWSWWQAPLHRFRPKIRWSIATLLTLGTAAGSFLAERHTENPFWLADAAFYLRMAQGRMSSVQQPFASRPLAPLLARDLSRLTHLPLETGFAILGIVSLLFLLGVIFGLAMETGAPRWFALLMATVAFWPQLWHGYALPDLPYAALLAALLLLLRARQYTAAALFLLPLTLARESTMLVLVCLVAVGWRELRPWRCGLALLASALGSVAVRALTRGAAGNPEHLPAPFYLLGKVPWNLLRTFGVVPWSNLYPYLCPSPVWQVHVGLGSLGAVGVCGFSAQTPIYAGMALLTTFGLLPLLLLASLGAQKGGFAAAWSRLPLMPQFCLVYGGISFLAAGALGTTFMRLFGYGWPLFLVALPVLLGRPPADVEPESSGRAALGRAPSTKPSGLANVLAVGLLGVAHLFLLYTSFQFWGRVGFVVQVAAWAVALGAVWIMRAPAPPQGGSVAGAPGAPVVK